MNNDLIKTSFLTQFKEYDPKIIKIVKKDKLILSKLNNKLILFNYYIDFKGLNYHISFEFYTTDNYIINQYITKKEPKKRPKISKSKIKKELSLQKVHNKIYYYKNFKINYNPYIGKWLIVNTDNINNLKNKDYINYVIKDFKCQADLVEYIYNELNREEVI